MRALPRITHKVHFVEVDISWDGNIQLIGKGNGKEFVLEVPLLASYSLFRTIKLVLKKGFQQLDTLQAVIDKPIRRNPDGTVLE